MFKLLLLVAAVAFVAYAGLVHWKNTDPAEPTLKRVKAAAIAAAMAIGGAVTAQVMEWAGQ